MSSDTHYHLIIGQPVREHRFRHERRAFAQLRVLFYRERPRRRRRSNRRRRRNAELSQRGLRVRASSVVRGTCFVVGHNALVGRRGGARALARRRRPRRGACDVGRGGRGPERVVDEARGLYGASEIRVHQAGHRQLKLHS